MFFAEPSLAQEVDLRPDLCTPTVVGSDDLARSSGIPVADDAFLRRDYRLAFHAYYQFLFCFQGNSERVSTQAEDSGAASILRAALSAAYDRKYGLAVRMAKKSYQSSTQFGEASLIEGDLQWIMGNAPAAFSAWTIATETSGYAQPGGSDSTPLYRRSAERFIRTLRKKQS